MSCLKGKKPLISEDLYLELESEYLNNSAEDGMPLLMQKLETKEPVFCAQIKNMSIRAADSVAARMSLLDITLPSDILASISNDLYLIAILGYLVHSRGSDIDWENNFKTNFDI